VSMPYPWGGNRKDDIYHDDANYEGTGGQDLWKDTAPVMSFRPNGYGLHDMAGNVWEWCADWYDEGYYAQSLPENPKGPSSGTSRVLRGGSWAHSKEALRVYKRYHIDPKRSFPHIGFRCASETPP